jgi:hypothetical protein
MCFPGKGSHEKDMGKFGSLQIDEKFWNKDLYDNRVIFKPCRLTETFIEFTGYGLRATFIQRGRTAIM